MPGVVKLRLFCVMFCPLVTPVFVFPNLVHVPLELLHHCAVMVCVVSWSFATVYSAFVGVMHICVLWLVGASLFCVGALLVVNW